MSRLNVPMRILRDHKGFLDEIAQEKGITEKITWLSISAFVFFAVYGIIMGASHSFGQSLSSAIKLPILFLLTLVICFPTLYIFNTLFGSNQKAGQYFALLLSAVSVTSLLLMAFAPITLFFLLTTSHYQFFKLLNVAIFVVAGFFGIRYFYQEMCLATPSEKANNEMLSRILILWIVLYAFVGSQLAWTIRPFFGSPDHAFEIVRDLKGNFYTDIIRAVGEILGFN